MSFPFLHYTQTSSSLPHTSSFTPPHPLCFSVPFQGSCLHEVVCSPACDFSQSNALFKNKYVLKPRLCAMKNCQVPPFNTAHFLGVIFMLSTNSGFSYIPANSAMKLTLKCMHYVLSFQCLAHRKTFLDVALLYYQRRVQPWNFPSGKQQNAAFLGFFYSLEILALVSFLSFKKTKHKAPFMNLGTTLSQPL